jgi:chitodextrinase
MGRSKKFGTALIGALVLTGTLTVPDASPAPVAFSPTPMIGWSTNGIVRAVLIVGNTAYVGGDFTQVRGPGGTPTMARARLAAFDLQTGAIRTGFSADANSRVYSLASDGTRLFVGGDFTTIKGQSRARLASLDLTTGNVNTGFSANASSRVLAMRTSGTRLYVAGQFTTLGNQARSRLAAVSTTTGAVDPGFNPNADAHVKAVTVSPDGNTVYAGGDFTAIGGGTRSYIASLSPATGALLPLTFQYPLVNLSVPTVIDLDISPAGDRLIAALGGYENQALSWSTVTGRRQWGRQVQGDTQAVKYFNGNVYFGFHEGDLGGDLTVRLLAADASTGVTEPTLRPTINSFYGVWDIDASVDALVIGGEFTNVNGVATTGFAILPRTSTDPVVPTPPSNLRVEASTSSSITLAWNPGADNVGVAAYRVLRNGVEVGFPTTTTFTDTDLPGSTDFTYSVQTVDSAGNFSAAAGPIPAGTDTTVIPAGATWRYLDNGSNQGTAWRATAFNDSTWASGPAQLGYGDGDEATVVSFGPDPNNRHRTTYFRHQITIDNVATLANVNLTLLRDDGAVVYVNGVEVARSNMPTGTITSTTYASSNAEGAAETQLFTFPVPAARFVNGTNTIAVEIHQQYRSSSDISFDLILSTGRTVGPLAPANLRTTSVNGTSVGLAWDAPGGSGIAGYRVFRDGVLIGSPSGTTFPDSGLTSAQPYSYTVTAVDTAGLESPPTAALPVTTADVIAPATPTGLAASGVTAIRAVLDWAPATDNVGVTGYEVRRDEEPVGTPTGTTFTDNGVAVNTSYSYTVRARDAAGNWSPESDPLIVTTPELTGDITAPSVPANLRPVSRGATALDLAWDASSDDTGVTGYLVSRNGVDLPVTTLTTLSDVLLSPGLTYTYTVRAMDGALNTSAASAALVVTTHLAAETTVPANSVWRYTDDGVNRGTAWRTVAYDDSTWKTGAGQLGYGDGGEATVMFNGGTTSAQRWISHYLRRSFTISDAARVSGVTLSVLRDDGVVVYVNGVEAFRNNMPAGTINFNTFASTFVDGAAENVYNDFAIPPSMLVEGNNVIAISVHQNSRSGSGDLSFDARLTTRY